MSCTVVVGGQYGSEGNGKVVALISENYSEPWVVRCGGPNSGHTVSYHGRELVLRHVPAGVVNRAATLFLSAGCAIDTSVLTSELDILSIPPERIVVDPRAVLIGDSDRETEKAALSQIASTSSGTGAALVRRMSRSVEVTLAQHSVELKHRTRVEPVAPLLHEFLDRGGDLIVEGTQGFGLSLLHGPSYPYVTARDTTAAGFASEVGLSPRQIDFVVMVVRTFPIRVGGTSGPLANEITWEEVKRISGAPELQMEYTSVTKRLRRVGRFDLDLVRNASRYNRPTSLALMGLDRLDYSNHGIISFRKLSQPAVSFIRRLEEETSVPVELVGTGFDTHDSINLKR